MRYEVSDTHDGRTAEEIQDTSRDGFLFMRAVPWFHHRIEQTRLIGMHVLESDGYTTTTTISGLASLHIILRYLVLVRIDRRLVCRSSVEFFVVYLAGGQQFLRPRII
jgi:hypothetical protein